LSNLINRKSPFQEKSFSYFYSKLRGTIAGKLASKLVSICGAESFQDVIDIGCGPGQIALEISKLVHGVHFTLVERSPYMLELARKNFEGAAEQPDFILADVESDLKDALAGGRRFDLVLAIDVWHLLDNRRSVGNFIRDSCLKNAGKMVLALHGTISHEAIEKWKLGRDSVKANIEENLKRRYPKFTFGVSSKGAIVPHGETKLYIQELQESGFRVMRQEEDKDLADVNSLPIMLQEMLEAEVGSLMPSIPKHEVKKVIRKSLNTAGSGLASLEGKLATELIYVLQRS
jgi:SAM-dependent methyltransferase